MQPCIRPPCEVCPHMVSQSSADIGSEADRLNSTAMIDDRRIALSLSVVNVLNHGSMRGSKVLVALTAAQLGYSPFQIGVIFALYSVFPLFLALYAGRMADRYGALRPMRLGTAGLLLGLLIPFADFNLYGFCIACGLIGGSYIFFSLSMQNFIGHGGDVPARTKPYRTDKLLIRLPGFCGPFV